MFEIRWPSDEDLILGLRHGYAHWIAKQPLAHHDPPSVVIDRFGTTQMVAYPDDPDARTLYELVQSHDPRIIVTLDAQQHLLGGIIVQSTSAKIVHSILPPPDLDAITKIMLSVLPHLRDVTPLMEMYFSVTQRPAPNPAAVYYAIPASLARALILAGARVGQSQNLYIWARSKNSGPLSLDHALFLALEIAGDAILTNAPRPTQSI